MIREFRRDGLPGIPMLLVLLAAILIEILVFVVGAVESDPITILAMVLLMPVTLVFLRGLYTVAPGEGRVRQLFGAYRGTSQKPGLRFTNPFYSRSAISLRVRNFETAKLKVNDLRGNPIEIAAVVVWKVVDTAQAKFSIDHFERFVNMQSEAALRNLASAYPYDAHSDGEQALSGHIGEVSAKLRQEIQERVAQAGVEIIETRVSHLAYAPEIAAVMLRRQQAEAVVAARRTIVAGAVGMVEHALEMLAQKKVIDLDEERRAAMVSNLLVVLCSEQNTQPVVNAGTLYT